MAIQFKVGTKVRFKQPVIEGRVKELRIVEGDVRYMVEMTNPEGGVAMKDFTEEQLEAVE